MGFSKRYLNLMLTIVLGASIAAIALNFHGRLGSAKSIVPTGFTMVGTTFFAPAGEVAPRLDSTLVRHQRADGAFKETTTYFSPDGGVRIMTLVSSPDRGTFNIDEKDQKLDFVSLAKPLHGKAYFSEDFLKSSPNLIGEGTTLGFKTYILREPEKDGYSEEHFAPALLGLPVKMVRVWSVGTLVTEATHILLGDPDAKLLASAPDYRVDYAHFEKTIETVEQAKKSAIGLRNELAVSQATEAAR